MHMVVVLNGPHKIHMKTQCPPFTVWFAWFSFAINSNNEKKSPEDDTNKKPTTLFFFFLSLLSRSSRQRRRHWNLWLASYRLLLGHRNRHAAIFPFCLFQGKHHCTDYGHPMYTHSFDWFLSSLEWILNLEFLQQVQVQARHAVTFTLKQTHKENGSVTITMAQEKAVRGQPQIPMPTLLSWATRKKRVVGFLPPSPGPS